MSIKISKLKKYIGERLLLDIPDLTIKDNARIGIVGKNGSGKTTLLKLIEGKLSPDEGQIVYSGEVAVIEQFIESDSQKSGGEQTKEKIRQSMSHFGEIILADEPTNHLDKEGRSYLIREMKQFKGSILTVSHDRNFLNQMCDGILEIDNGVVTLYPGNYDVYLEQKEIETKEYAKKYDNYVREKSRLEDSMQDLHDKSSGIKKAPKRMGNSEARLHKRGKGQIAKKALSKQALGIETRLDKLEKIDKPRKKKPLSIPFLEGQVIHKKYLIETENFDLSAGNKGLLVESSFKVLTGKKNSDCWK